MTNGVRKRWSVQTSDLCFDLFSLQIEQSRPAANSLISKILVLEPLLSDLRYRVRKYSSVLNPYFVPKPSSSANDNNYASSKYSICLSMCSNLLCLRRKTANTRLSERLRFCWKLLPVQEKQSQPAIIDQSCCSSAPTLHLCTKVLSMQKV